MKRAEQEGFENVVKLTFSLVPAGPGEPQLRLTAVDRVGTFVEWPLSLSDEATTPEPLSPTRMAPGSKGTAIRTLGFYAAAYALN